MQHLRRSAEEQPVEEDRQKDPQLLVGYSRNANVSKQEVLKALCQLANVDTSVVATRAWRTQAIAGLQHITIAELPICYQGLFVDPQSHKSNHVLQSNHLLAHTQDKAPKRIVEALSERDKQPQLDLEQLDLQKVPKAHLHQSFLLETQKMSVGLVKTLPTRAGLASNTNKQKKNINNLLTNK